MVFKRSSAICRECLAKLNRLPKIDFELTTRQKQLTEEKEALLTLLRPKQTCLTPVKPGLKRSLVKTPTPKKLVKRPLLRTPVKCAQAAPSRQQNDKETQRHGQVATVKMTVDHARDRDQFVEDASAVDFCFFQISQISFKVKNRVKVTMYSIGNGDHGQPAEDTNFGTEMLDFRNLLITRERSASAGSPMILRQCFWIDSSESDRCLGSPPQTGPAYSRIGLMNVSAALFLLSRTEEDRKRNNTSPRHRTIQAEERRTRSYHMQLLETIKAKPLTPIEALGDNFDILKKPSPMTMERQRESWHWFLFLIAKKRIVNPELSNDRPKANILTMETGSWLLTQQEAVVEKGLNQTCEGGEGTQNNHHPLPDFPNGEHNHRSQVYFVAGMHLLGATVQEMNKILLKIAYAPLSEESMSTPRQSTCGDDALHRKSEAMTSRLALGHLCSSGPEPEDPEYEQERQAFEVWGDQNRAHNRLEAVWVDLRPGASRTGPSTD
ncbi:hypothetical protein Bbelb_110500 [Branchiostoma belcheri]|nr:hypothetical protein Bbelb_110500 [Branchiostoma belcheri]